MSRYIDADELLNRLPDDLPYKASVKRVLMQAPTADIVRVFAEKMKSRFKSDTDSIYTGYNIHRYIDQIANEIIEKTK